MHPDGATALSGTPVLPYVPAVDRDLRTQARQGIAAGAANLAGLQDPDGSWHVEYSGPTFTLPLYIALRHIARTPIDASDAARMREELTASIDEDGSIGLFSGGAGNLFASSVGYVALRLLGEQPSASHMTRLRTWIHRQGTPLYAGSWGKAVLCVLGLYEYRGLHPLTPELWLLPRWAPGHPRRIWCHARQVHLPLAWLYGRRAVGPVDDLTRLLRTELYTEPYEEIDWARHRSSIAPGDNYRPLTPEFRAVSTVLGAWEHVVPVRLRRRALKSLQKHMDYEDQVTGQIRIGPINAVLNTLVQHFRHPHGPAFREGLTGLDRYLWDGGNRISMQSYESSQLWDTSFAVQAGGAVQRAVDGAMPLPVLSAAVGFIHAQQIRDEPPQRQRHFRDASRGGWPFSTRAHGWPITDCTAEALRAVLTGHDLGAGQPLRAERIGEALELLLAWQNPDGGWPTYERIRSGRWLERLNSSQVFGDVMVDYSHVECTSSCLQALAAARRHGYGDSLTAPIERSVARGRSFLGRAQRPDGGFEGTWGICFTYGTWFGVEGLLAAGVPRTDPAVRAACRFLTSHQRADGSWGESPQSCLERRPLPGDDGKAVMTAWALMALVAAGHAHDPVCERAVRFLLGRQGPDGSFPREGFTGVFSRTTMLDYDCYRHYFPLRALAEWLHEVRA